MKRPSSFILFRGFLILAIIVGLFFVSVSFLPFETVAGWLNGLSPDGEYSSFSSERFQFLARVLGAIGIVFVILSGWMLIRWQGTQAGLERLSSRLREFNLALRADARNFFKVPVEDGMEKDHLLLLGLVLAAVIMRLASLNIPLIHDEAYMYNAFASGSLWQTISDYHLPNNHVLQTILVNILTHLFGNHLWLIRLPTIIAGVLMVPAGYMLGKRLYSGETGILSAGLIAVFPILVTYSVLARGYAFLNLFTLAALILGDRVTKGRDRFAWLLLVIVNALGFFTIPIMLFPFGALYVWLFLSGSFGDIRGYRSKWDFFTYWLVSGMATALLTTLLYGPILVRNFELFFGNRFVTPLKWGPFKVNLISRLQLTWNDWMGAIPDAIVVLGVVGFFLGLILHFKLSKQKIPLQVAFFLWIAALVVLRRPDMMARMWLFIAAPLLIWSAGGIVEPLKLFSNALLKKAPLGQGFVILSVIAVFVYGVVTIPTIPERWAQKSSVESASLYLRDTLREGDMVTANTAYFPQLRYYFGIYGVSQDHLRKAGPFERMFIVIGERGRKTLESVVPVDGKNRPVVDMQTVRIVLEYKDLVIYEGRPVP